MDDNKERLQKVLSQAGIASRRKSEELILEGRVKVNGEIINTLGFKVSKKDVIEFDGKPISRQLLVYYVINKPLGYFANENDKTNGRTVMDLLTIEDKETRIFSIGMMDSDTSGAVILTNDGNLAYKLNLSKKEFEKEYQARIDGIITQNEILRFIKGVEIDNKKYKLSNIDVSNIDKKNNSCLINFKVFDSKLKTIKKIFEELGHPIKKIKRISFAGIDCIGLSVGSYRPLKPHEIKKLYSL